MIYRGTYLVNWCPRCTSAISDLEVEPEERSSHLWHVRYPILDEVAKAMNDNPQIKKLQIDGHTDNEGTEDYNLELSENRAKAVMDYLVSKGVDEARLTYKGYGFSMPKASNRTEEGKAINRRVEFTILEKE